MAKTKKPESLECPLKIERLKIGNKAISKLKTNYKDVDMLLSTAVHKLNIARICGDFLFETTATLAVMCQKLFNELEELREARGNTEKTGNAALALPRRNCDVGDPEEQAKRFHEFCRSHWTLGNHCSAKCPFSDAPDVNHCQAEWAQMPYGRDEEEDQ